MATTGDRSAAAPTRSVVFWIISAAVGIGLASASGSAISGTGTSAGTGDVIVRAGIGAAVGIVITIVLAAATRRALPGIGPATVATAGIVVCCVAALIGIASAPGDAPTPRPAAEPYVPADFPYRAASSVTPSGVVAPIDIDGDGRSDAFDGIAVLGFDADGDGVEDGRLDRCASELSAPVGIDMIGINRTCSSDAEFVLEYDSSLVLTTRETIAPPLRSTRDRVEPRGVTDTQGTIVLLVALGMLLVAIRFFATQVDTAIVEVDPLFLEGRDVADPDEQSAPQSVAAALQRSLASLLGTAAPRDAILAAYAALLDELDTVGLGRHRWEGPMEHCRRCLAEAQLPSGPIDGLVDVFTLARFGDGPMTVEDRDNAADLLTDSIALLRAHERSPDDTRADRESVASGAQVSM